MSGEQEQKPETESEQLRSEICRLRKEIEGLRSEYKSQHVHG
jgi:hypothetical protein